MRTKLFLTFSFIFIVNLTIWAQYDNEHKCHKYREKIKSEEVAYITNKLDFSVKEAQKFWPIFNEFHNKANKIRDDIHSLYKNLKTSENLTNKDYSKFLAENAKLAEKELGLKKEFEKNLLEILSPKKIALLYLSKKDFKRKIVKDIRKGKHSKR